MQDGSRHDGRMRGYFPVIMSIVFTVLVIVIVALWDRLGNKGQDLWVIISFCLIFALVLSMYLQTALAGREQAEKLAESRTRDLSLSEQKYRNLFEQSRDAIVILDMEGTVVDANPAALEMTGFPIEEVRGRPYSAFIPEQWKSVNAEVVKNEVLVKGYSDFYDREYIHKDGTVFPARGRAWVLGTLENGRASGVILSFSDATEIREAEEALKESATRLTEAQALAHIGSWAYNIKSRGKKWSDEIFRILELDPELTRESYRTMLSLVHPADRDRFHQAMLTALSSTTAAEMEFRLLMSDGRVKYIHQIHRMFEDQDGTPSRIVGTVQDITERRRLEEVARLNQARTESLIRIVQTQFSSEEKMLDFSLNEAIALTDSRIGYIYFYDEAKKLFTLNTWSTEVMKECLVKDRENLVRYELDKTGIWGEAVRQAKPIIINDFQAPHHLKKGFPEGHVPLTRFLTIPIFSNERIVAVIGVANKETPYDQVDVSQLTLLMGSVWQICERKRAEDALKESEERFRVQFKGIPVPTYTWQHRGSDFYLVDFNDAALDFTRGKIQGFLGMPASVFYEGRDPILADMRRCFSEKANIKNEAWETLRTTGEKKYLALKFAYLPPDLVMMHMDDITIEKEAKEHLVYLSIHDPMTGLYNRFYADSEITRLKTSRRFPVSFITVDVDGLKTVNDTLGHAAGDMLINNTAYVLRQTFRPEDVVARVGGDEFLVILPSMDSAVLNHTLNRLKVHLENYNASDPEMPVSFSVGAAIALSGDEIEGSLKQADMLMYRDKALKKALANTG
jgi:diguanylate cyclase (GGDEF)-like protein/PAS domain S-box-containing protein